MSNFLAISGWVMTALFGGLSVFQFIRDYIDAKIWELHRTNLENIKRGLVQTRAMLTEAGDSERVVKTDAVKQFIQSIGHQVRSVEHTVDLMLESNSPKAKGTPKTPAV